MASVIGFGAWPQRGTSQGGGRAPPDEARPFTAFSRLMEVEFLPRLLVAHAGPPESLPVGQGDITDEEVAAFAPLAVTLEAHELLGQVEHILKRGVSVERLLVDLLAPAARYLGEQWKDDRLDFVDVTMGLWRLQEVLREIGARSPPIHRSSAEQPTALFAPFPGEQHSFGPAIVDECFARAGWDTELLIDPARGELIARAANRRFDLIGLTVSCDSHIAQLPSLVTALRNVSKNPNVSLMLGGRVLVDDPGLAAAVGADGTAPTALDALDVADRLLAAQRHAEYA